MYHIREAVCVCVCVTAVEGRVGENEEALDD